MEEDNSVVLIIANKQQASAVGTLLLPDCVVSITHKFENEVTEHPIDGKASISDHVVNRNVTITLSGIYNTYAIQKYKNDSVSSTNRVAEAYRKLLDLRNSRTPFSVVSKYDVYNDCVVKSLSIPVAPDDGNTLIFNMDVVQVRLSKDFDNVRLVNIEDVSVGVVDSAQVKSQSGVKQKTRTLSDPIVTQLDNIVNGGG